MMKVHSRFQALRLNIMFERLQLTCTFLASTLVLGVVVWKASSNRSKNSSSVNVPARFIMPIASDSTSRAALLPCITARRSILARHYEDRKIDATVVQTLLDAAMWAPFHGPVPPWRFVVLGKDSLLEMQHLTLDFYDANWRQVDWGGKTGDEDRFRKWRSKEVADITARWGPVSFMIAIVMRRQAGSKLMPEWEEIAATASAVQNMHLQATTFTALACYWSSWHSAARDSAEMKAYLNMSPEDKLLGFFIVAACNPTLKDNRQRDPAKHLSVEWRA